MTSSAGNTEELQRLSVRDRIMNFEERKQFCETWDRQQKRFSGSYASPTSTSVMTECTSIPWNEVEDVYESIVPQSIAIEENEDNVSWNSSEFDYFEESDDDCAYDIFEESPSKPLLSFRQLKTLTFCSSSVNDKIMTQKPKKKEGGTSELENYYIDVSLSSSKHPPAVLPPTPADLNENQLKRRYIVESIVNTENSYINSLEQLLNNYERPLLEMKQTFMPPKAIDTIFFKLREIHQCHRTFQIELADRVTQWDQHERIGDCFIAAFSRAFVLDVYGAFVQNFSKTQELIRKLRSKKGFKEFFGQRQSASKDLLSLDGLLVKPIQRFPQFKMLLQDLLKNTPSDHCDRFDLLKAITVIESLAIQLNEVKRDAEQRFAARHLFKNIRGCSLSKLERRSLRLISHVQVIAYVYNKEDSLKQRRKQEFALFNRFLMCLEPRDSSYQVRWIKPLAKLDVAGINLTPDMHIKLTATKGHTTIRTSTPSPALEEAQELSRNLEGLMHDFVVFSQIANLLSSSTYHYDNMPEENVTYTIKNLQLAIQQKEHQLRLLESTVMTLDITKKGFKKRRLVFEFEKAKEKRCWIEEFTRARLGCREANQTAWFSKERDALMSPHLPLFMGLLSTDITKSSGEPVCAVAVCLAYGSILKRRVWCCGSNGGVSILSVYNENPEISENFPSEASGFLSVEVVPGILTATKQPYQSDMIWMGTSDGHIFMYRIEENLRKSKFLSFSTLSPVITMCSVDNCVYTGMKNGFIAIYRRQKNGAWNTSKPEARQFGEDAVSKILEYRNRIYIACENRIYVLDAKYHDDLCRGTCGDNGDVIRDFSVYGHGVWIAYRESTVIRLWNADLDINLQEINIQTTLSATLKTLSMIPYDKNPVTCLKATKHCLWIGTNTGFLCGIHLPGLENCVPIAKGPPIVTTHSHIGSVNFILAYQNINERTVESVSVGLNTCPVQPNAEPPMHLTGEQRPFDPQDHRRVSLIPTTNKWLSTPNLMIKEVEDEEDDQFEDLYVPTEDSEALTANAGEGTTKHGGNGATLIVTAGRGYKYLKQEQSGPTENTHPCVMLWYE